MATKTKNYNLIKPDLTDDADVRVINGNMDVLDTQLKAVADSATSGNKNAYTNITVSSDYTWKFTKGSGANVSYDTIKKAISADGVRGGGSYKPNVDSTKYSQLQYHFGTIPNKGATEGTLDCGTLKFNHWGASPFNTALSVPNNSGNRPFLSYQNGTAGTDYTTYKELAWKTDADAKLDKTGGTLTGTLYTSESIFKTSNNSVLQLGGSTDGTHGARINLSGEKQLDAGLVKITADNGTNSNVFEVSTAGGGSKYTFNGLTTYMNSSYDYFRLGDDTAYFRLTKGNKQLLTNASGMDINGINCTFNSNADYFRLGDDTAYFRLSKSNKQLLTNAGGMTINGIDCTFNSNADYFKFGTGNNYLAYNKNGKLYFSTSNATNNPVAYRTTPLTFSGSQLYNASHDGYVKFEDGLLIQWGTVRAIGTDVWNQTKNLPLPYENTGYVALITHSQANKSATYVNEACRDVVCIKSESAIGIFGDNNMVINWMTIGKGAN